MEREEVEFAVLTPQHRVGHTETRPAESLSFTQSNGMKVVSNCINISEVSVSQSIVIDHIENQLVESLSFSSKFTQFNGMDIISK